MLTKEQRIKTAFILSILGASTLDLFFLGYIFYYRIGVYFSLGGFESLLVFPILVAPLVLGCIAQSLIRDIGAVTGKNRVFYVFARVLSVISIVEGAIFGTIGFVTATVNLVNALYFSAIL